MWDVVVVDPPWPQRKGGRRAVRPRQGRSLDYSTMAIDDIAALMSVDVIPHLAPSCAVFVWTIEKFFLSPEKLFPGLRRHTTLVWDKGNGPCPAYTVRFSHEYIAWLYPAGHMLKPVCRGRYTTVVRAPARQHSRKPDEFYAMLDDMFPGSRRLDVFSREFRHGWSQYGDQTDFFQEE